MPLLRDPSLRIVLASALFLALAAASAPARPSADAAFAAETSDYLERLEALGFAGVVLVARDGVPLLAEGYGLADRERGIPWTPGTVSTVGSITKQYTGAAILALAEGGRLRVEDALPAHFEGVPEDKRGITLHQLLTHSSGIVGLGGYGDWDPIGREEFVERILAQPLAFEPGTGYEYSNAGYSLLGAIIERLTGGSYEAFLRERFFLPLGIYETGYVMAGWGDETRLAQGYRGDELWGTVLGRPMAEDGPYWVLRANGGIHTTAWDVLRWTRGLLEGRLLGAESRERLWSPHVREGEGADSSYGYGWAVMELEPGLRVVTHNGGNGIFFADLALVPDRGLVIFLQTNVAAGNGFIDGLLGQIGLRLAAGEPYPDVPRVVAAEPERFAALAGEWRLEGGGGLRAVAEEDGLRVAPLDAGAFARLLSSEAPSPEALSLGLERNRRLEEAMRAVLAGDAAPLQRLYGDAVTLERLSEVWSERLARFVERHGALQGFEVLGTARRGDRDYTLARVRYQGGAEEVAFVWQAEPEGRLLGISLDGMATELRFRAEAGGGFASWDPASGTSTALRTEGSGEDLRLVFGGDPGVEARRAGPTPGGGDPGPLRGRRR